MMLYAPSLPLPCMQGYLSLNTWCQDPLDLASSSALSPTPKLTADNPPLALYTPIPSRVPPQKHTNGFTSTMIVVKFPGNHMLPGSTSCCNNPWLSPSPPTTEPSTKPIPVYPKLLLPSCVSHFEYLSLKLGPYCILIFSLPEGVQYIYVSIKYSWCGNFSIKHHMSLEFSIP